MRTRRQFMILSMLSLVLASACGFAAERSARMSDSVENLLVRAKVSGNLESFNKGQRGAPQELVYDLRQARFVQTSQWLEYGVGFGRDLGVVSEQQPAWWMAEWTEPVEVNWISLTGAYPNQPQPQTAWKIETRRNGHWATHASGVGGWYDRGRYIWGVPDAESISLDAIRVSVFSKDESTPISSVHFRGKPGQSWIVARLDHDQFAMPAPFQARIMPLTAPVMVDKPVTFDGSDSTIVEGQHTWDFGDGSKAEGKRVEHRFQQPGIRKVTLTVTDGRHMHTGMMIVRVHTSETLHVPQVYLDTDQKNEQDDQHYFGYALFSELDLLGVNSVHHGGGQEPINYREILHVLDLAKRGGLPEHRAPLIFRGADTRLWPPASGNWYDTEPEVSDASDAILAAARGASPTNPVWVVPVGPATNVASAILQARAEGLELKDRLRMVWLGGTNNAITPEFNGDNDPWSMVVIAQSGLETWIIPAPVGARLAMDKRTEGHLYADNPLGQYLEQIMPELNKALYDASALAAIISMTRNLGWIKKVEYVTVAGGPDQDYAWTHSDDTSTVRVIREIDQAAMKRDLFGTMRGNPTPLIGISKP